MSKYHNKKTEYLGYTFASLREAVRYQELLWREKANEIEALELQPRYNLVVNGLFVGFYKADFRYKDRKTGNVIVEDAKGVRTSVYQLKKKLMKALYNIDIVES